MTIWYTLKEYIAGAIALIACPCHLPLTFPLLLSLTAGTALGSWLEGRFGLVFVISTVIFIGGLALAMRWTGTPAPRLPPAKQGRVPRSFSSPIAITIVTSSTCKSCGQAKAVWERMGRERPLRIEMVDINSSQGRELAATHNIFTTPTSLVDGKIAVRGVPSLKNARRAVGGGGA